jgi:hypothetical protein
VQDKIKIGTISLSLLFPLSRVENELCVYLVALEEKISLHTKNQNTNLLDWLLSKVNDHLLLFC